MSQLLKLTSATILILLLSGFGKPEHSEVKASFKVLKDGKAELLFKVAPKTGMKVTYDAPWHLKLVKHDGLDVKDAFAKADLDKNIPGFKVLSNAVPKAGKGEVEYKLTAFICTEDKTRCYREVHKGKTAWAVP